MKVNVDLIAQGKGQGELAAYLLQKGRLDVSTMKPWIGNDGKAYITVYRSGDPTDVKSYQNMPVAYGTLRRDEWKHLDDTVLKIAESRLVGIQDLIDNGLVYNLGNAMGTTVLEWHDQSDALEAEITMDGLTRAVNDRVVYEHGYLPIPIIHADYVINERVLSASRNMGNPLDSTMAERAARKVAEKLEQSLFTDTTYSYGELDSKNRNTIYSYLNHPDRNGVTLSDPWDDSTTVPRDIIEDVIKMKQTSIDAKHYGPWMLYVPTGYETILDDDYEDTATHATGKTIRERILAFSGIKGIKVVDTLPADNVLLVQMTKDVVQLVRGLDIQNIEWTEEGKFVHKYKVIAIQVPWIRSDQNGKSGIVHLSA